jgi:hypothetical protein
MTARLSLMVPLSLLAPCLRKVEREYKGLEPDAEPHECWTEVEALTTWMDETLPGWRQE